MNCQKCGSVLEPTDSFCKNCGEPVPMQSVPEAITQAMPNDPTPNPIPNIITGPINGESVAAPVAPVNNVDPTPAVAPEPLPMQNTAPMVNETANVINQVEPQPVPAQAPVMPPIENNPNLNMNQAPVNNATSAAPTETPAEPAKKKNSPILVAILIIALVAIVGFEIIYFVKPFDKKENNTPTEDTTQEETTDTVVSYSNWMNYVLTQNITDITLVRTNESGDIKNQRLSEDDLNNIFTKLANYTLLKVYSNNTISNKKTFASDDKLIVAYTKDNKSYELKIDNGNVGVSAGEVDNDLVVAIEESEYTEENEKLKDTEGTTYKFMIQGYDSAIFDEYFVSEKTIN